MKKSSLAKATDNVAVLSEYFNVNKDLMMDIEKI